MKVVRTAWDRLSGKVRKFITAVVFYIAMLIFFGVCLALWHYGEQTANWLWDRRLFVTDASWFTPSATIVVLGLGLLLRSLRRRDKVSFAILQLAVAVLLSWHGARRVSQVALDRSGALYAMLSLVTGAYLFARGIDDYSAAPRKETKTPTLNPMAVILLSGVMLHFTSNWLFNEFGRRLELARPQSVLIDHDLGVVWSETFEESDSLSEARSKCAAKGILWRLPHPEEGRSLGEEVSQHGAPSGSNFNPRENRSMFMRCFWNDRGDICFSIPGGQPRTACFSEACDFNKAGSVVCVRDLGSAEK